MTPLKTVAFLARWPGFLVLEGLMKDPRIDLVAVYTHGALPRAEGGGARPETYHFQAALREKLHIRETSPEDFERVDLILSLSWRRKIPVEGKFKVAAINIHRGELLRYAGAGPVKRAITTRASRLAITAHHMTDEIDGGDPIAVVYSNVPEAPYGMNLDEHAELAKEYLYPLYWPLVDLAITTVARPRIRFGQDGRR